MSESNVGRGPGPASTEAPANAATGPAGSAGPNGGGPSGSSNAGANGGARSGPTRRPAVQPRNGQTGRAPAKVQPAKVQPANRPSGAKPAQVTPRTPSTPRTPQFGPAAAKRVVAPRPTNGSGPASARTQRSGAGGPAVRPANGASAPTSGRPPAAAGSSPAPPAQNSGPAITRPGTRPGAASGGPPTPRTPDRAPAAGLGTRPNAAEAPRPRPSAPSGSAAAPATAAAGGASTTAPRTSGPTFTPAGRPASAPPTGATGSGPGPAAGGTPPTGENQTTGPTGWGSPAQPSAPKLSLRERLGLGKKPAPSVADESNPQPQGQAVVSDNTTAMKPVAAAAGPAAVTAGAGALGSTVDPAERTGPMGRLLARAPGSLVPGGLRPATAPAEPDPAVRLPEPDGPTTQTMPVVPVPPAVAATAYRPKPGAARRTRKARLRLSQVDPWSVMKTGFLFSIAAGIMLVVAIYAFWTVLSSTALFESINTVANEVIGNPGDSTPFSVDQYLNTQKVMGVAALLACFNVVIFTALATLGSFLYNLAATMLGGLEITLAED